MHKDRSAENQAIAIVGMGCIFPGSRNLKEYWNLLFNGIDAIQDIPEDTHWKLEDYYDEDPATPDKTYCRRGGFLPETAFDTLSYGIPPNNLEATDTSQLLGLEVAGMALADAGYQLDDPLLREKKVNVILGVTGTQELVIPLGARLGHPIWKKALKDSGITEEKQKEVLERIQGDYVQWQENSFPGLLGNVVAGRIANRLNLSGTNTVTDAACASSLSALHTAVMELLTHKCDISITGGADALNDIFMHMCFSKTGVLSHTSDARPFSKDADGTVLGEGVGMLVLKRLEDAQKDNDRIYAVIKGIGTSSDGRTSAIYAPEAGGQLKALRQAYNDADVDPSTVGLIEAHGTGTRVGDKVEFDALKQCFKTDSPNSRTAIGSVKSMIGHTKAAAGAAGIIKTALALYNKVLPPTLKADKPDPELDINNSNFYLNAVSKPWASSGLSPRRSGVSAFGFGGSNFHAVLEEYKPSKSHASWDGSVQIFAFSSDQDVQIKDQISSLLKQISDAGNEQEKNQVIAWEASESRRKFSIDHNFRLLIVHNLKDDLVKSLKSAIEAIETGQASPEIYFEQGKQTGRLGFLFPGQGSQYPQMGKELFSVFPEALQALEDASRIFLNHRQEADNTPLDAYIFPPPAHLQTKKISEEALRQTDVAQPAIGAVSLAMIRVLERFSVFPDITCGHSYGELSALCSAGWIDVETFLNLSAARGKHMAAASRKDGDPGSMLAVKAPLEEIEKMIQEEKLDLILANKNSYSQGVLSGPTDQIKKARKICRAKKQMAVQLPVAAAFHSKFVEDAAKPFQKELSNCSFSPGETVVLSNTSGKPYPHIEKNIEEILGKQLASPVNFVANMEQMSDQEVTTFLEVGPKSVLTGLADSILKKENIQGISLDNSAGKKSGIEDIAHGLCLIASKGFQVDLTQWEDPAPEPTRPRMAVPLYGSNPKPKNRCTLPESTPEISTPPKSADRAENNGSEQRGSKMTYQPTPQTNQTTNTQAFEAMKMVQKGLEAMQQLQAQTARAHEKFLETQAQASKTLASMMDQTRTLTAPSTLQPATTQPARQMYEMPVEPSVQAVAVPEPKVSAVAAPEPRPEPIQAEVEKAPAKKDPAAVDSTVEPILFDIVSKLTGFPVEMLEPEMNIESDLGIDSIKKVEIISELEKQIPSCDGLTSDNIGSVRTLKDICDAIQGQEETEKFAPKTVEVQSTPANNKESASTSTVLMETISELTGFPVEMLEPSMNLESDLGIDSIKRVEILSKLEQQLDHIGTISSDDMAGLKTIEEIVSYLAPTDHQTAETETAVKKKTPDSGKAPENKKLTCQTVGLKKYPTNQVRFYNGSRIELPAGKKVYLTQDSARIAEAFKDEFQKAGIAAELIQLDNNKIPDLPDIAGLVIIPDAFTSQDNDDAASTFLMSAFRLVKKNAGYLLDAGKQKGAFLCTVTFMGGSFGFDGADFKSNPIYGGLPGLAKTADIEWKNVLCRALDMSEDVDMCRDNAEAAAALMLTQGSVEMGLDGDNCNIPFLENQDLDGSLSLLTGVNLSLDDVIVISGGAKGVTAACAVELARKFSPTIILIGRSPLPDSPEPEWAKGKRDPANLKKAILKNDFSGQMPKPADLEARYKQIVSAREIMANIEQMEQNGSTVSYFQADITDAKEVKQIFETARQKFGPVSGIFHGAGVLEDRLIVDKQVEQFSRVLDTKIKGMDALLKAGGNDALKYVVLFSSVAARSGNQGQCDYAMANEVLNKSARKLAKTHTACKFLALNWGPWEGGMVNPSLKKEFERRGIDLIPLQSGAEELVRQMGTPAGSDPEVVIGAHLVEKSTKKNAKLTRAMDVDLGTEAAPILAAHKIGGTAVVPFALHIECMAHAAEKNNPGLFFAGMDDMRLLKGIKSKSTAMDIRINLGKCRPSENGFDISGNITSSDSESREFVHSSCTMILKEELSQPPVLSAAAFMDLKPFRMTADEAYREVLFHGEALQGIKQINGCSPKGIEVITAPAPSPDKWLTSGLGEKWVTEPMMLDAAFQAAILWTYENKGQVCLPSYIANLRLYETFNRLSGDIRILFTVNEDTKNLIKGYFTFLNEDNAVVASITGFEAITDPSLTDKFKNEPLFSRSSILAFAEGSPSEAFGDKYKPFDSDRQIARLPRPPYFFMDRVLRADHPQWEMTSGGWIEAEYDIPENEWYFKANRTETMPFAVLLEIALQPCGWLAAYAGSALQSGDRLYFRNLGGKAQLIKDITKNSGTLTMRSRMKEVSKAGGMIIQDFDMEVLSNGSPVYSGTTNFGFFTEQALSNQVGIRNSRLGHYQFSRDELASAESFQFKNDSPLDPFDRKEGKNTGMPSKALRMFDEIEAMNFQSGLYGNGFVKAVKVVDPSEWFFDAHFYQDPVCPGSLGVESFIQMLRFYLIKRFDLSPEKYRARMTLNQPHEWIYRGQIIPSNKKIEISAHIKNLSSGKESYSVVADGALVVDGICIYEMQDFGVEFSTLSNHKHAGDQLHQSVSS